MVRHLPSDQIKFQDFKASGLVTGFLAQKTSFSFPGLSMFAKSVAPQKTRVPQVGSSLAFLSPFVPFVPGTIELKFRPYFFGGSRKNY